MEDFHTPFQEFKLITGEPSEAEDFIFNFSFTLYDLVNVDIVEDLSKIGILQAKLHTWFYNNETFESSEVFTPLTYH